MGKFQNPFAYFLGTLMLFCLLFSGCKREKENIAPLDDHRIDAATLSAVKQWYEPKVARLRGAKTTNIDIYLPQWGQGLLYDLPNGEKVATFPVHRQKNVQYHDIGFVRRFAVRLDAQNNVKGVKLVEMIAPKNYLRLHKETLTKRYVQGDTIGLRMPIWSSDIVLTQDKKGPEPCKVTSKTYTLISIGDQCYVTMTTYGNCGTTYINYPIDCAGMGSSGGGSWNPPPPPPSGGGGTWTPPSGGNPPSGGGGGSAGSPIYDVPPPPPSDCTTCPADGLDDGDNTDPPLVPTVSPELDAIWAKNPKFSWFSDGITEDEGMKMIDSVFLEGINGSPKLQLLYERLKAPLTQAEVDSGQTKGVHFKVFNLSDTYGRYYSVPNNDKKEHFVELDVMLFRPIWRKYRKLVLFSELFHAYQERFYDGKEGRPHWKDVPPLNIECEQRFFIEYIEYLSQQAGNPIFGFENTECFGNSIIERNRLINIIKAIKQGGGPKPSTMGVNSDFYTKFWEDFRKLYPNYDQGTANPNMQPIALFSLFN